MGHNIRPGKVNSIGVLQPLKFFKIVKTLLDHTLRQIISTRGLKATSKIICTESTPNSVLTYTECNESSAAFRENPNVFKPRFLFLS